MLDKRDTAMLDMANRLTAEELDQLRATATEVLDPGRTVRAAVCDEPAATATATPPDDPGSPEPAVPYADSSPSGMMQGDRERLRTRESKIATACVGQPRVQHDWWPIGTELEGRIGPEVFTAVVVRNPQLKSGRSIRITSGSANGRICRTPTRAALEATEAYRQANNLGRAGGVTNGWDFWNPKT